MDAIFIVDNEGIYKSIHDEAILKVQMDYGEEIFRIAKCNKRNRDIVVFARQITTSETLDMWLEDVRPTETKGLSALNHLKVNSIGNKNIEFKSDIDTISTAYYQRMSVYKAIHSAENSFINRWGGEVLRRGYTITINKRIGLDRGVQIRSGKNLTGFEANTNIDNVVTRIRPVGYNGITTNTFIDSQLKNKYSSIKTKEIKYDDVKVKDENNPNEGFNTLKEAQAELTKRAEQEFSVNHIDELKADYRINFINLEQTEEYKDYIQTERIYLGDTVYVYEEKHDININVRCVSRKYDVLKQKVIEIELSNTDIKGKTITTSDILSELNNIIKNTNNNNIQDIIQSMINSGIKDSYVINRQNEILIMDTTDINTATNVWRWNVGGLAHSKTGYYGTYETAITQDGSIVASMITAGLLHGRYIAADTVSVDVIKSNNENPIIHLFGNCAIDATKQYEKGQGTSVRLKWDDYDYLRIGEDIFDIYTHSGGESPTFRLYGGQYTQTIQTQSGIITINRNGIQFNGNDLEYKNHNHHGQSMTLDTLACRAFGNGGNTLMHNNLEGNNKNLGWSGNRFNQLSAKSVWADEGSWSDRKLKENIRYLDNVGREISAFVSECDTLIINENLDTLSDIVINKEDLFYFIRDDLKLTQYNYIEGIVDENFNNKINFIANDLKDTKVGQILCGKHEGNWAYNLNNYISIAVGALQEEIKKREALEERVTFLEKQIKEILKINGSI